MAGDWIKVEHATIDKPEVLQMAELLETSADDVLGKLFRVWVWFDQQSRDGNAGGVTGTTLQRFIDRLVASQGFASCMAKVGWLSDSGIPNFNHHNGESAKKRALTKNRVKEFRNAHVTPEELPEKRREEKKETTARRASRLPADWTIPEDWRVWTRGERPHWDDAWITKTASDFHDFWLAAPKGQKLDWLATWRKWVRNSNDPKGAPVARSLPRFT